MKTDIAIKRVILCFTLYLTGVCASLTPIRNTEYGNVQGFISEKVPGQKVEQYLGIPYAAPPVRDLRLEPPLPPEPWTNLLNASHLPPACPQNPNLEYVRSHLPSFDRESEDCLYLNIYAPQTRDNDLTPVLVFIHGGSNRVGMGAMLSGDVLAGYGQIVVVTFNYRLGSLGFYGYQEEGLDGNYGLLDQTFALKWVKQNIHAFGGDESKVTVAGHSAGAADVGFHIVSPLSKGLFRSAIVMSGSPLAFWSLAAADWKPGSNLHEVCQPPRLCPATADQFGYSSLKEFLKSLAWQNFTQKILTPRSPNYEQVMTFPVVIVDGEFLTDRPEVHFESGNLNCDTFLFSFTKDEGALDVENVKGVIGSDLDEYSFRYVLEWYKPIYPSISTVVDLIMYEYGSWEDFPDNYNDSAITASYTEMESDIVFIAPMIRMADMLSKTTDKINVFSFDYVSALSKRPKWQGIPHGDDLFYLFGYPLIGHAKRDYNDLDRTASKIQMSLWSNFVKYQSFSVDGVNPLTSYKGKKRSYNRLIEENGNITISQEENYKARRMAFWNKLLPDISAIERSCSNDASASTFIPVKNKSIYLQILVFVLAFVYSYSSW